MESPSQADFLELAEEFELPLRPLANCLDPEHLPRCDFFGPTTFFILRHSDSAAPDEARSIQQLTTKIVFVVGRDFLLTVHRAPLTTLSREMERSAFVSHTLSGFIQHLYQEVLTSFDGPIEALEKGTEAIEGRVFALRRRNILRQGYRIKSKSSTYRKVFKFTSDVLLKLQSRPEGPVSEFGDLKEALDRLIFYTDNIYEDITGLLNLHIALMSQKTNEASYKTNEIMRVLTAVSIFFLPLNFIAGIYGMNFVNMPELKTENGYFITLGVMVLVALSLLAWIYKKAWLKKEDL